MTRRFASYVGVDLGGGRGKNTALALLVPDGDGVVVRYVGTRTPSGAVLHDAQILQAIARAPAPALVAVDAPLTLPVCVRCPRAACVGVEVCEEAALRWLREQVGNAPARTAKPGVTPYTQRVCELFLQRTRGLAVRETLGQGMGPLTARMQYLRRALAPSFVVNDNLIEVAPRATLAVLLGDAFAQRYKRSTDVWRTRAEVLERLKDSLGFAVWREGCLSNDHCFDAVICAYTGFLWARDGWQIPAEAAACQDDGWIWVPPAAERSDS